MSLHDIDLTTIDGAQTTLAEQTGKAVLVVNVASACGLTPQYAGLQELHDTYAARGFAVLGFPCNQFGAQEPGTEGEIKSFCETSFGVTFPMFAKLDVNGEDRHPLYAALTEAPDADGASGDVQWNFEKFLVSAEGEVLARFRPRTEPLADEVVAAVEKALPA